MKKIFILLACIPIVLFISCVVCEKEGDVHYYYKVTGNATDVTIIASTINYHVTSLPWQSETRTRHIDDETSLGCTIEAINNTTDNSSLTVEIYIDGELKASKTANGPNCSVYTSYTVDSSYF